MFNTEKGTILYFAILILSVIFTIASYLSLIILGQLQLQREIGHSVIALCAADTGIERAMYAIYKENNISFSTSSQLENGATFQVNVSTSSSQCATPIRYYCIKSLGSYGKTNRKIEASY